MTVQYMLAFVILHNAVETLHYLYERSSYVSQNSSQDIYWLNGAVSSYTEWHDENSFLDFAAELEKNPAVEKVGYTKEGYALAGAEEEAVSLIAADEVYGAWEYRLLEGKWLDFNTEETQFVLGGDICRDYNVGDVITIQTPVENENQTVQYRPQSGRVVGLIGSPAYAVTLNMSGTDPEFINMLYEYDELILTNDAALLDEQTKEYPVSSLLIKIAEGREEEALKFLEAYGECTSYSQIKQNSKNWLKTDLMEMAPPFSAIMLIVLYGIIAMSYTFIHRNSRALAIYEMCGQSVSGRRNYILLMNGLPMLAGFILSFLIFGFEKLREILEIRNIWTDYHIISSLILSILFTVVICLCTKLSLGRSTVANMRRTD